MKSATSNLANPKSPVPGLCLGSVPCPPVKALPPRGGGSGCSGQGGDSSRNGNTRDFRTLKIYNYNVYHFGDIENQYYDKMLRFELKLFGLCFFI